MIKDDSKLKALSETAYQIRLSGLTLAQWNDPEMTHDQRAAFVAAGVRYMKEQARMIASEIVLASTPSGGIAAVERADGGESRRSSALDVAMGTWRAERDAKRGGRK